MRAACDVADGRGSDRGERVGKGNTTEMGQEAPGLACRRGTLLRTWPELFTLAVGIPPVVYGSHSESFGSDCFGPSVGHPLGVLGHSPVVSPSGSFRGIFTAVLVPRV